MAIIVPIGQYCGNRPRKVGSRVIKYSLNFSREVIATNVVRLTNQIWKLIPMRENNEEWRKQLDTVILEIAGLSEIFNEKPCLLQILSKLEGLRVSEEQEFWFFRKTIFEVIDLLQECKDA